MDVVEPAVDGGAGFGVQFDAYQKGVALGAAAPADGAAYQVALTAVHLDPEGEETLSRAVRDVRAEGSMAVLLSQRPCAVGATDHMLMLEGGSPIEMGETADVLRKLTRSA